MHETYDDIPLPNKAAPKRKNRWKYPYPTMEVGASFYVPLSAVGRRQSMTTHSSSIGKQLGRKFATRSQLVKPDPNRPKNWMPAEEGDEGAVPGVGVWRNA